MKKIVSLLAIALFATVFAAGCGKMEKCSEANGKGKEACEKKEDFKDNKQCVWEAAASAKDADGKCKDKEESPEDAAKKVCEAADTDAKCTTASADAAVKKVTGASCNWDDTKMPKCQLKK